MLVPFLIIPGTYLQGKAWWRESYPIIGLFDLGIFCSKVKHANRGIVPFQFLSQHLKKNKTVGSAIHIMFPWGLQ